MSRFFLFSSADFFTSVDPEEDAVCTFYFRLCLFLHFELLLEIKEINLDNTNDDLRDKASNIVLKKNNNSVLEQLEAVKKKKKMTTMISSSVRAAGQAKRFVKL